MTENELSNKVIGICIDIHKRYGPGLLESVYEAIFCHEWEKTGIPYTRQQAIPLVHENIKLEIGFRSDVIIDNKLLIDFKSIEVVPPIHYKRIKTYLKLTGLRLGMVINFCVELLKQGVKRVPNGLEDDPHFNAYG